MDADAKKALKFGGALIMSVIFIALVIIAMDSIEDEYKNNINQNHHQSSNTGK